MIRPLTTADIPAMARIAPLFWEEGKLPGRFDPEVFTRTWVTLMDKDLGHILGSFKDDELIGALGFLVADDLHDGVTTSTEMFWFVHPDHRGSGVRLLLEFEHVSRRLGAKRLIMVHLSCLNAPELSRLYERRGYREIETHYLKEIL